MNKYKSSTSELIIKKINFFGDILNIHRFNNSRYPFLLQSSAKGNSLCRYDILFAFPQREIILNHNDISSLEKKSFLQEFDNEWKKEKISFGKKESKFPFHGGWFVYLGYELISQIESKILPNKHRFDFPIAFASRIPAAIIKDNFNQETFIICEKKYKTILDKISKDIKEIKKNQAY